MAFDAIAERQYVRIWRTRPPYSLHCSWRTPVLQSQHPFGSSAGQALPTQHAAWRAAQRSLPADVLEWLLDLGARVPAGHGAELVRFDRQARASLASHLGRQAYTDIEPKLAKAYAIVGADGAVITVGHRTRRMPRR